MIAGICLAPPAAAQQVWQDGRWIVLPQQQPPVPAPDHDRGGGNRWGGTVNGRWYAGAQAPGGWAAYRRPVRGFVIPGYWIAAQFRIPDYLAFGLAAPPRGHFWIRYYDDAVLVDDGGRVWDWAGGIAWDGTASSATVVGGSYSHSESYSNVQAGAAYPRPPIRPVDPNDGYHRQDVPVAPDDGYRHDDQYREVPPPPPCPDRCPGRRVEYREGQGGQTGYRYEQGGRQGYYYVYGGPVVTTITIQSGAAMTTTTTTVEEEVVEERSVSTARVDESGERKKLVRRTPSKRVWRAPN